MTSNLKRYEDDLDKLIEVGQTLDWAMRRDLIGEDKFKTQVEDQLKEKADDFLKNLPNFKVKYQVWYSEAKALLRQVLPDRLSDFVRLHEKPKGRKIASYGDYFMEDYLQNLRVTSGFDEVEVDRSAAMPQFEQMLNIVKAAKSRFKSSLFDIKQMMQADLFDQEIDAARHLHKQKFTRAAGAVAGVVLERHLGEVAAARNLKPKKAHPSISELNELLKSNDVIDIPTWRGIMRLSDLRNLCDHNKAREPTSDEVEDLISGVDKFLKTLN